MPLRNYTLTHSLLDRTDVLRDPASLGRVLSTERSALDCLGERLPLLDQTPYCHCSCTDKIQLSGGADWPYMAIWTGDACTDTTQVHSVTNSLTKPPNGWGLNSLSPATACCYGCKKWFAWEGTVCTSSFSQRFFQKNHVTRTVAQAGLSTAGGQRYQKRQLGRADREMTSVLCLPQSKVTQWLIERDVRGRCSVVGKGRRFSLGWQS